MMVPEKKSGDHKGDLNGHPGFKVVVVPARSWSQGLDR